MDELWGLCKNVAYTLHRRYPMVEREDIFQEVALYCMTDSESFPDSTLEKAEFLTELRSLRSRLRKAGDRYCRLEKAAKAGYEIEDECFYSLSRLKELVEIYYATGIEEHPPIGRDESVRRTSDGSEAGTWISSLLDIERGLSRLSDMNADRLRHRYDDHAHMDDSDYAFSQGLTVDQSRGRVRTSLKALQRELGGASPWNKGPAPHTSA